MPEHDLPTALVTGAAGGLGFSIARRLAERGDHVVVADLGEDASAARADELRSAGFSAEHRVLDVTDEEQVVAAIAEIDSRTPLSTVVNNAGVAFSSPLLETPMSRFDLLFSVNVRGTFLVMREAARAMTSRGAGSIVNICSTSSFTASTGPMIAYDASKGAAAMMTRAAGRELARTGVRVNGLAPGTMDTPLVRGLGSSDDELAQLAAARIPVGRLGGTDEVAEGAAWLSSPAASYVVGHILVIDGGWLA
ncbi:SDR family NAD(P)-dependent oxidoreductase [Amnibacterium flavum]|uniref:Ketoreductase domain-containing protein n=1 Tax=Amnibacterium flavum TaxID=2173173 RepID=A0A2V1HXN7_9MICO|nr:SDR family NAD(P)-dependent oxidoreductase [Amnibacterium flavum]PVZ96090.1 hypothetical protein DDQ50_06535 [Amnibacterium flavum]